MRRQVIVATATAAALLVGAVPAHAYEAGDWLLRAGVGSVDPKSDNGDVVSVDSGSTLVFNGSYFLTENWAVEVLASAPFSHDIDLKAGGVKVGETKHLPPTVSLQYHFLPDGSFHPYVGAGLNYTLFFDQDTTGPLAGSDLDLDNSFGPAAQIGADIDVNEQWFVNVDLRWADIDTDADLDGAALETVKIDPMVYSLTVGWRF